MKGLHYYIVYMITVGITCVACSSINTSQANYEKKGYEEQREVEGVKHSNLNEEDNIEKKIEDKNQDLPEQTIEVNIKNLQIRDYVKLADIRPKRAKEIPIKVIEPTNRYKVVAISDGYISIGLTTDDRGEHAKGSSVTYAMYLLDNEGHTLWEKKIDLPAIDYVHHLIAMDDDSYIIEVSCSGRDSNYLLHYDKEGILLWKRDLKDFDYDSVNKICVTNDKEILLVGEASNNNEEINMCITSLDQNGDTIKSMIYGGSNIDRIWQVQYHQDMGIVINGHSQSTDGDFRHNTTASDYIAYINDDLELQWIKPNNEPYSQYVAVTDKLIYRFTNVSPHIDESKTTIYAIDKSGKVVNQLDSMIPGVWTDVTALLPHGYMIAGVHETDDAGKIIGNHLVIVDDSLNLIRLVEEVSVKPDELIPLQDGGVILKASRNIQPVSQPAYISWVWYDSEVVLVKYNDAYEVEWRKTYDSHGDHNREWVYPTVSGKVLVEVSKMNVFDMPYNSLLAVRIGDNNIKCNMLKETYRVDADVDYFKYAFQFDSTVHVPYVKEGTKIYLDFGKFPPRDIYVKDYVLTDKGAVRYSKEIISDTPIRKENNTYYVVVKKHMGSALSSFYDADKKDNRGIVIVTNQGGNEYAYVFVFKSDA